MSRTVVIDRDKFVKVNEASKKDIADYVLGGRCVSFDDYRNKVGQLRGIDAALDHFHDLVKKEEDDDD